MPPRLRMGRGGGRMARRTVRRALILSFVAIRVISSNGHQQVEAQTNDGNHIVTDIVNFTDGTQGFVVEGTYYGLDGHPKN